MRTPRVWTLPTEPVTTALLHAAGVSTQMIRTQVRNGRLLRLRQGVYLATAAWPSAIADQHQVRGRAEVVANPGAVLSHQSAALSWGLPSPGFKGWSEFAVSVSFAADDGHGWSAGAARHHQAMLPLEHRARDSAGYPITSLARTAVDLAAGLNLPEAWVLLDAAARKLCAGYVSSIRRSDLTNPRLVAAARAELADVATALRRTRLLSVISGCDPARESVAESLSAGHFRLAGLPQPRHQVPIDTAAGVFFPDCYWSEVGLIGECDGAVKYADSNAYVHEKQREQALRDAGYPVVRWLAKEIMTRPSVVVERVRRALDANQ